MGPDVWLIDGPEVRMRYAGVQVPFSTRTTAIRLRDGSLWLHSPVALSDGLAAALEELGEPRHLIAPSTLHHGWLAEWKAQWPGAKSYVAPGLIESGRVGRDGIDLGAGQPGAWSKEIEHLIVTCGLFTEVVFMHHPSRTLVLTDLIENFELDRVCGRWRWIMRAFGCADPDGKAPLDMQLSFIGRRKALRAAVEQMIAWDPERVLFAHGRPYLEKGSSELRRAFRWILD